MKPDRQMDSARKAKIVQIFPDQYEEGLLNIELSADEYRIFENGIWASQMEEKWNVFVESSIIYFARSWTDACIYKVFTERKGEQYLLSNFHVNRDKELYKFTDIGHDRKQLLNLIQRFIQKVDKKTIWLNEVNEMINIQTAKNTPSSENRYTTPDISKQPTEEVILFESESPGMKISMSIYFNEKGQLYFDGYDIGKNVEDYWGDSDYEYTYTIEPAEFDKFYKAFNLKPGDKSGLLQAIKERFSVNKAYSLFGEFMVENNMKFSAFTWT